jgi:hypothetical protein
MLRMIALKRQGSIEHQKSVMRKPIQETTQNLINQQDSVPSGAILDNWSESPWSNGVQVDRMDDMKKLEVRTRNSLYEITVIDGNSGEILIRGGRFFPQLTPANLAGATVGGCICKLRGIYEGFVMELTANGQRTVTTPVEWIGILA